MSQATQPDGTCEDNRGYLEDPNVTADTLLAHITDTRNDLRQRVKVAAHPNLSTRDVLKLIDDRGAGWDFVLSCTELTGVLDLFADNSDPYVRCLVAFNPATPTPVLERLANDTDLRVRVNAGMNGNLTTATRVLLARHDPDDVVRDQIHWVMTTSQGREVLNGARFALYTADANETPSEHRVLAWS